MRVAVKDVHLSDTPASPGNLWPSLILTSEMPDPNRPKGLVALAACVGRLTIARRRREHGWIIENEVGVGRPRDFSRQCGLARLTRSGDRYDASVGQHLANEALRMSREW